MTNQHLIDILNLARQHANHHSDDSETKVGCVLLDSRDRVMSLGYNRTCKPGCPTTRPDKYPYMIHAEIMAITSNLTCSAVTLVCTHSPCQECAKHIVFAGITKVFYGTEYANCKEVCDFLNKLGVATEKIGE